MDHGGLLPDAVLAHNVDGIGIAIMGQLHRGGRVMPAKVDAANLGPCARDRERLDLEHLAREWEHATGA